MTKTLAATLSALAILASHSALAGQAQRYDVQMKIHDNGVVIGEPRLVVTAGERARIEVGQPGSARYAMGLTVDAADDAKIRLRSTLTISPLDGPPWSGAPTLIVQPGELSAIEVGTSSPTRQPTRIEIRISALEG